MSKQVAGADDFDPKKKAMAEELVGNSAEHMTEGELGDAARSGKDKFRKLEKDRPSALEEVWEDLKTLIDMISDYVSGDYREVPWKSIAMIGAAVLYFVSPIDLIPDFIPVAGFLDDAFVIALCMKAVREDIDAYREWKEAQKIAKARCASCGEPIPAGTLKCSNPKCAAA